MVCLLGKERIDTTKCTLIIRNAGKIRPGHQRQREKKGGERERIEGGVRIEG